MRVPCASCRQWDCVCGPGEVDAYYVGLRERMIADGRDRTQKLRETFAMNPDLKDLQPFQAYKIIEGMK